MESEEDFVDNEIMDYNNINDDLITSCKKHIENLESFVDKFIFSDKEINDLTESAFYLINEIIINDTMIYIKSNFENIISEQVSELLKYQLADIYSHLNLDMNLLFSEYVNNTIYKCISNAFEMFYKDVAPVRSYVNTFNTDTINDKEIETKIEYLKNIKQPQQRTPEWYEFRQNVITASNIYNIFKSDNTLNTFIYDKCKQNDIEKYNNIVIDISTPMGWGQLCEPLSIQYYENKYNTKVGDFGCILHKNINCLAASPDGINIIKNNGRYGRMLEIKNITNRNIDGIPKLEYWIQMQIQMEVCDLDECDFLETQFKEYENEDDFNNDFDVSSYDKGIIIYLNDNGNSVFKYSEWGKSRTELEMWKQDMLYTYSNLEFIRFIYWRLEIASCVLVPRNKLWFNTARPLIENTWKTITEEKKNGNYLKRVNPNKKLKNPSCLINMNVFSDNLNVTNINDFSGCEIDFEYYNSID